MPQHHTYMQDIASASVGFASAVVGQVFINPVIIDAAHSFLLGACGAAGGWLASRVIQLLINKIKQKQQKKKQP